MNIKSRQLHNFRQPTLAHMRRPGGPEMRHCYIPTMDSNMTPILEDGSTCHGRLPIVEVLDSLNWIIQFARVPFIRAAIVAERLSGIRIFAIAVWICKRPTFVICLRMNILSDAHTNLQYLSNLPGLMLNTVLILLWDFHIYRYEISWHWIIRNPYNSQYRLMFENFILCSFFFFVYSKGELTQTI